MVVACCIWRLIPYEIDLIFLEKKKKKNLIVYRFSYSIIHLTKKADCLQCWICASCIKTKITTIKSITRRVKRFGLWHVVCDIFVKIRSSWSLNRIIEWLVRQLLDYRWRKLHFLMCVCYHLQHRHRDRRYSREPQAQN